MPDLDAQVAAVRERSAALPDLPAADLIRHVVANSRVRLRLDQFDLEALNEGTPMPNDDTAPIDSQPDADVPARRVSLTVTGYLRHGLPVGGFYDMQTAADGGMAYSIPESAVDESSVRDAPPEQFTKDDWSEITGYVTGRYGMRDAERILAAWDRAVADIDFERAQAFQDARDSAPQDDALDAMRRRAAYFEATVQRVRALAVAWSGEDAEFGRHWHEAARTLHETLDGPADEADAR